MASLTNRPNGIKQEVHKGTYGRIVIQRDKPLYKAYRELRSDDKVVMDALLELMTTGTNSLVAAGETLNALITSTGFATITIRNTLVRLTEANLITRGTLDFEVIVTPTFAFKGNETEIWKYIQALHYKGSIPRDVIITEIINEFSTK